MDTAKSPVVKDDSPGLAPREGSERPLSLYHLLDPEVLSNPYPLFHRLRTEDPVHWDPYLHAWVVTRYADVVTVLHRFSAQRMPTPEQLSVFGLGELNPIAQVIVRQMIFIDPPSHTRLRTLCATAFTPARAEQLRAHIQEITDRLISAGKPNGRMDIIAEFANLLPAIVTAGTEASPAFVCAKQVRPLWLGHRISPRKLGPL